MTTDDIASFIASNAWTFATTMPDNPHWYAVRAKCNDEAAFEGFVMHIRAHGYTLKFKGRKYTCFNVDEFRYWTMGAPLDATIIINRAKNVRPGPLLPAEHGAALTTP
jgi:hypothetical protein